MFFCGDSGGAWWSVVERGGAWWSVVERGGELMESWWRADGELKCGMWDVGCGMWDVGYGYDGDGYDGWLGPPGFFNFLKSNSV
jgi:hypothetical protein